jgi:RNA-directed DNA polymerase
MLVSVMEMSVIIRPVARPRSTQSLIREIASRTLDPATVTPQEERKLFADSRDRVEAVATRVGQLVANKQLRAAQRTAYHLRSGLHPRLVALARTKPKRLRRTAELSSIEAERRRVRALSLMLHLVEAVGDMATPAAASVYFKPTNREFQVGQHGLTETDYRAIFKFGWGDRARQHLLHTSLLPFADFHPSQYMLRHHDEGRGRSGVCEALRLRLPHCETDTVFLQFDVRNFYGSISHAWVEDVVPLPTEVTRAHVHTGAMLLSLGDMPTQAHHLDGVRQGLAGRGIPGGSALSPLIGEMVMSEIIRGLSDLPGGGWFITYSDNLGVFVPRAAVEAIKDLFRERFSRHAAGPFELRMSAPVSVRDEFRFLGYWWKLRANELQCYVPPEVAETKLLSICEAAARAGPRDLLKLDCAVQGIAQNWRYWDGADAWRRRALDALLASAQGLPGLMLANRRLAQRG